MKQKLIFSKLNFIFLLFLLLNFLQVNAQVKYDLTYDIISPVYAKNGMVASEQNLATKVGIDILKKGGNAVDASVAVGFALAVVLPNAGNIGGGGFMMIHEAKTGKNIAVDFREVAPQKSSRNMYLDENGNIIENLSTYSHLAVGVPGTVAGLTQVLEKYGTMKLSEVMKPAINLAKKGFIVSSTLAKTLDASSQHLEKWNSSKDIFFKNNKTLKTGDLLIQKDLAKSLKLISRKGAKTFYEGEITEKIIAEMEKHNGLISADDLKNYKVIERIPVVGNYHDFEIISMPPPSSGGVHIIQMLNMLEKYPLKDYGVNSAKTIHLMSEVMKLAYIDRSEYLGDPDFVNIPRALTSRIYSEELFKKINPNIATKPLEIKPGKPQNYESDQTTHYSVADKDGNLVAVTYTLNLNFGSGIVASGTGILLNNQMDDFSSKSGVANAYGLVGGDANSIVANKRPLSSMSPTFVLKDKKPFLVTGSPGGSRIITTTMQIIINVIEHKMNIATATITPRVHHQWLPDKLRVENGLSNDTINLLKNKGHHISVEQAMGRTQSIQINEDGFYGFSDPRNPDGSTLGF